MDSLIFVVAVGCLVFAFVGIKRIKSGKHSSQWETTTAKLEKVLYNPTAGVDRSDDSPYSGMYKYKVKGKVFDYYPSNVYGVEKGVPEEVEVIYNVNEPERVYHGKIKDYLLPLIVGVCLLLFFVFWTYNVVVHGLPKG